MIAQTLTATPEAAPSLMETIGPIITILSLLLAGWQRVRALNYRDMLHAAAVGLKAALDAMPAQKAEEIKGAIKETVGPLNEAMKAEVRKATAPAIPAYKDDGPFPPRAAALLLCAALLLAPGCLASSVHDLAVTQQLAAAHLHDTSVPDPAWLAAMTGKPDKDGVPWTEERLRAVWAAEWAALEASSAKVVEVSK